LWAGPRARAQARKWLKNMVPEAGVEPDTRFEPHGILSPHLSKSIGRHESRCSKSWLSFGSPSRGIEERQLPQRSRRIAHFGHNSATWGRNDGSAVTARDPCLKRAWLCTWGSDVWTGSPLGVTRQVQAQSSKFSWTVASAEDSISYPLHRTIALFIHSATLAKDRGTDAETEKRQETGYDRGLWADR